MEAILNFLSKLFLYLLSEDGVVEESNTFLLLGETSKRLLSIPMIASSSKSQIRFISLKSPQSLISQPIC